MTIMMILLHLVIAVDRMNIQEEAEVHMEMKEWAHVAEVLEWEDPLITRVNPDGVIADVVLITRVTWINPTGVEVAADADIMKAWGPQEIWEEEDLEETWDNQILATAAPLALMARDLMVETNPVPVNIPAVDLVAGMKADPMVIRRKDMATSMAGLDNREIKRKEID